MAQILRHFIRESLQNRRLIEAGAPPSGGSSIGKSPSLNLLDQSPEKRQQTYASLLLLMLIPSANVGDTTDPCANYRMQLAERDRSRVALYVLGALMAGVVIAESVPATIALWRAGTASLAAGSRVMGVLQRGGAILTALNVPMASKQWYDLHVLCLSDPDELGMSEVERDGHIANAIGNLYINFALSGYARSAMQGLSGAQIIEQLKSSATFTSFASNFYNGTVYLRSMPAATVINTILGYSADGFYREIIKSRAESLDLDTLYEVNPELIDQLSKAIDRDKINTIMINVARLETVLMTKILALCDQGKSQEAEILYKQYLLLTSG